MAVDFGNDLLPPIYDWKARPITVTPVASAPTAPAYQTRGIYDTEELDILGDGVLVSDQKTIVDIRDEDFLDAGHALPQQGDRINIPASGTLRALGDFEVVSTASDGGGQTMLEVRRWEPPTP